MTKFGFGSKNRPKAREVVELDPDTKEPIGNPYFIIFNSKGELLNAPVFSTFLEAEAWIDNYLVDRLNNQVPK